METDKKWYVVYTKPRWEKKVAQLVVSKGLTSYCPLNRVMKKWSDRMKKTELPLLSSYVFVQLAESEKTQVREVAGVINYVYHDGKPAVIKDIEIERIKKFLSEYEGVEVVKNIMPHQRVQISEGLFLEQEGKVLDLHNGKARVKIDSLGYTLVAIFDKSKLSTD